jgi:hypothetical protein
MTVTTLSEVGFAREWVPASAPNFLDGNVNGPVTLSEWELFQGRAVRVFFKSGDSTIRVEAVSSPPFWLPAVIESLQELLDLQEDWDTYGSGRIAPAAAAEALVLVINLMSDGAKLPSIVPMSSGGIQLEWHDDRVDIEAEVDGGGEPKAWLEEHGEDAHGLRLIDPLVIDQLRRKIPKAAG